jgi:flavin reductase (DIM6/NTAB) family NADH-FMN oxidoreductase RutF
LDDGAAILDDSLAGLDCVVEEILQRRGHAIGIGRVRAILIRADGLPCFIAGRLPANRSAGTNPLNLRRSL